MNRISLLAVLFTITACGGGGGGGEPPKPPTSAPGISFSASPTSVLLNNTSTFSWSTTNATSCTASGSNNWTGTKATSGTEDVSIDIAGNTVFTLSCSGAGGTRNASVTVEGYRQTDGVVVDGYISGADVFIDENANFIADTSENATTSDNDGKYTIKYANGSLVSIGGTDLDSQTLLDNLLITHKLNGYSDFKAITPVTSVGAFMEVGSNLNNALGIDSSIDISVTDPVALKGDGGIYDYLYEKGNQLTILAYALQNITNDLNTTTETTQDYFKAIAEEVEKEFNETSLKVDIETETFINKTFENVITAKSVTIDNTAKENTVKALSGVLPIVEVKASDDLTTSVIRFAVSTLQEDIKAVANGTASAEKVASYTTNVIDYIAQDQNINSDDITPDISAIDDSTATEEDTPVTLQVLANDSYISTAPISITATNGDNGTVEVAESSPEQITYSPNTDYNGSDTFSYTIIQGDKIAMADVNVTITPVNDAPSIDIASTIQVKENQTAVATISVSDPDGDELTLTLGGTDADSFNLSSDNVLSFKEAPDYETKISYSISLTLTDDEETVDKELSIIITNVNEVPEFTSEPTFNAAENQTAIGTVIATDADGDDISFTVSGSELAITSEGILSFVTAPDYETKSVYIATVTASDGVNETTQDITININDVSMQLFVKTLTGLTFTYIVEDIDFIQSIKTLIKQNNGYEIDTQVLTFAGKVLEDNRSLSDYNIQNEATLHLSFIPVITSNAQFEVEENQSAIGSVLVYDPDSTEFTYSISGSDIEISTEGVLSFVSPPDYEIKNSYSATLTVSDGTNLTTQDIIVNIIDVDDIAPVITIIGDNPATVELGSTYTDAGATADGGETVTTSGTVDTTTVGTYTLTYSATDAAGNTGAATRTVNVVDTTAPIITVNGNNPATVELGSTYTDAGATADGGETVTTSGTVDTTTVGAYTLTYSATDAAGNTGTATRTVNVQDTTGPVITILGDNPQTVELVQYNPPESVWVDPGATSDNGELVSVLGDVDNTDVGTYIIEYSATDNFGNKSTVFRTVYVVDTTAPRVRLLSNGLTSEEVTIELGSVFVDVGAYGYDESKCTGELSECVIEIITSGTVDTTTVGTYTLIYSATDASGNTGTATRTVNVVDTTNPVITSNANFTAAENQTAIGTVTATDLAGTITFTISGSELAITTSGVLTFINEPDYETKTSYSATVTASDGTNLTTQDITVNVTNVNDNSPAFTSSATFSANENQTAIGTVAAFDADGDGIAYSISGSEITINSSTGVIAFASAPDHETKTSYSATVTASDGTNSTTQGITVNVTNVNDNSPSFSSDATFSAAENQTAIGTVIATDADGDGITYSISGSDITINSSSGVITFVSAPDYETKAVYSATVTASDGINSSSQIIEILVSNICEFDFIFYENSTVESRGEDWRSNYRYRDDMSSHSRFVRKFSANSSDAACPQPEIFDFKIEGPDAEFFELSSLEGNDYDRYYIYSTRDFDYENPLDADANNIYEYHLVGEYGGQTVREVLTLEIKNENEYGNVESLSFDQINENIQIAFTTNHDLPSNTAYIEFGVRGPSAPLRFFSGKMPYDSSQSNYNIEFSYGDQLGTDNISPELWGGYYQINKIIFYDQNENEIDSIYASRISGDVTTYVTVDSGKNFVKVKSLSGELTVEDENGFTGTRFIGDMEFENYGWVDSNSSRAAGTGFYPSLMLMAGSAPKGLNDYSGSWTFGNESSSDNGDGTFTSTINSTDLDFYTRTGKHEYRLRIQQRGYRGRYYYIYLYPQELLKFGYVDSYKTFVNNKASSEDFTGPALTYYSNLEVESCTYEDISVSNPEIRAELAMDVGYSQLTTSNPRADLTVGASDDLYYMYSSGDQYINGQTLRDTIRIEYSGKSREDFEVELFGVGAYDKALNYNRLEKNSNYHQAPEVRKVNLLDHCDGRIITNNAPVITSDSVFAAQENQLTIGSVIATDTDGDDISFTLSGSYSSGSSGVPPKLQITSDGVLSFSSDHGTPDYETETSYTASITASDGVFSTVQDITVNITDVNEAPLFDPSCESWQICEGAQPPLFSVAENQTSIGTVTARDPEGDSISYSISGADASAISLNSSTGALAFITAPDYETKNSYSATVTSSDGSLTDSLDITVTITNINDNSPAFTSSATFSAVENQTAIGTVAASDADGDTITYSISGSDITINSSSGVIAFASAPDYETKTSYSATVTASDGTNATTQDITVNVTNVNDNSPAFTSSATFSAVENQTAIGTVAASDADGDTITYSISGSDITINSSSGVIAFASAPDYETKTSYSATVTASDGTNATTQDITVNITNVNDNSPAFTSSATFSANENQTAIGTVAASDADGDTITYSISGSDITINSSSGVIAFASAPDYETKTSYSATITASDGANSSTQDITVNIGNLNENAPNINNNGPYTVAENQTSVTTLTATDPDGDTTISWIIWDQRGAIDRPDNDLFSIDESTGVLTFKSAPNFESPADSDGNNEYLIRVKASDGGGAEGVYATDTSRGADTDITIIVTNVNDNSPSFTSGATFSANENQTAIGTVAASDADGDSIAYSISGSDITINSSSGVIAFASAPDYETKTSYSATVTASDGANSSTQDITVNVIDVVENSSPVFTSNSLFTVAENQTSAATITVTDADNDSISFSLSGTDADSFAIDSSGALTFNNAPDYETKESYSLIVTASDGVSSVSQTITISISNVNEVPQISALSSTLSPDENQISIVTVSASDPDANTSLAYSVSGTDSSLFSISSSGVLTFKTAPDYETPGDADADNSYQINIVVSDGSLSVAQAITVQVQNVADLISGVAVDGYVAGATVFQDLNNDGDLDSGEPSAATNSLGSFSLNLSSVNINAPVRIYNGFDLASNEIHPSIMDISVSETGSYIVTPISTLVGRLKIEDTALSAMVPQSMIAGALGISLADSPNDSILGFDPIAYFNGSDATLASEARPVFAASQLLMTMGGGNYSIHKYITDQVLSSLSSTLTTATGSSITLSSANDILGLKQDAYDAIFNGYVDTTLANNPPINSIQFRNNKAVMTDYLNGSSSSAVNYSLYGVHDGTTTLVADLVGAKLDYDNLKQILDNDGTGTPMDLNFELANIPAAGSGSTGVTLKLFYGDDTTQDADEDYLQITLTANWESDGTNFKIKLPANSAITASFYDRGGTILSITPTNQVEDIFTVTKDGPNRPATLSLRLSKLFNAFPTEVTGLSSFLDGAAEFTYLVEFDNFTIYDHLDNTFTKIQGTFEVDANPGITVFADDIYVHENATSKDISFYLSQAASSDVTLDYAIADASTALSSDYSLSSGTVTIPAGSMSATLTIPVTNDTTVEAQEEIRLTLSNVQNAVLGRSSVSAFITDGEEILANTTQKAILADNIFKDSKASINAYIKNKLDTSTITISGTSYTYSQVLINNSVTTDVYAYLDSIIDDYEVLSETLISTIMTKADAYIDAQLSSFADYTAFATALTQLNSGIKGLNMSQIVGTNINTNGTFPSGQNATTLQTALDGKVDTLVTLAADTVADILGTDTNTNFPNANVVMGTDGDDTITGTSSSDLIASFGGTDTVNALAGNDKILGGSGVDTLNGGDDNDHLYGYAGADTLNGNAGDDLIYGGKDDDTIDGDAGDDSLYGEAGDDTITSGAGNDTLDGGLGDDIFIIDGSGNKTIAGSSGSNTLNINYSGISSMADFTTNLTDTTLTLTDTNGGTITASGIVDPDTQDNTGLTINSIDYTFVDPYSDCNCMGRSSMHDGSVGLTYGAAVDNTNKKVHLFQRDSATYATYHTSRVGNNGADTTGQYATTALTLYGSPYNDIISTSTKADTIYAYAGNDQVYAKDGSDTIDLGSGNDVAWVNTADLSNDSSIDGGDGSDTLNFGTIFNLDDMSGRSFDNSVTINMGSLGNATNFENLVGTRTGDDTLTGDANANVLIGSGGTDTLNGGDGNDTLYGDWATDDTSGTTYGLRYYDVSNSSYWGDDILNGGAGDDILIGNGGDDTLDGGAGADILTGGDGNNTFVITNSSGGGSASEGDTITDFTDGTDSIGFDTSLTFGDLTIEASGSDTVIKNGSTYLATISGVAVSNVTAIDFQSTSTSALTLNGTSGNDTLIGGAGNDIFNGLGGSDTLMGWAGNDTFNITNKSGAYADTVTGGAGNDVLNINYSGISSLADFTTNLTDSTLTLTDANGGTITASGIVDPDTQDNTGLTINSIDYTFVDPYSDCNCMGRSSMHDGSVGLTYGAAVDNTNKKVYLFQRGTSTHTTYHAVRVGNNGAGSAGSFSSTAFTLFGSAQNDIVSGSTQADTISTYAGNDMVFAQNGADTIDLGTGNDVAFVNNADLSNDSSINGGDGLDTLNFGNVFNLDNARSPDNSVTINMGSLGNATNFENLVGTRTGDDTLTGDANANVLIGSGGTDTLNGGAGNDTLYGDWATDDTSGTTYGLRYYDVSNSSYWGDDILNGGDGDDILIGNAGDDTLDGGAGADTLTGGDGNNTFVITSSSGGGSASEGDTITDFTDGTDSIGFDASLTFGGLTIEASGSDTVIKNGSTYLATISGVAVSNITAIDFQSTSTDGLTLNGTSGDDVLIGGAGDDTFNGLGGSDTLMGWAGNDTFNITNKSGAYADTVTGGAGNDVLNINYSGISSLADFTTNLTDSTLTLTDANGGTITASGIVDPDNLDNTGLTVNGNEIYFVDSSLSNNAFGRGSMHDGSLGGTYGVACDDTNKKVYMFQRGSSTFATYHASRVGWNSLENSYACRYVREFDGNHSAFTLFGSPVNDFVSAGPTADTLSTFAGNDQVFPAGGADVVDLGAGNDVVFVNSASLTEDSSIDGGDGSDTLNFGTIFNLDGNNQSEDASVNIDISSIGNAVNFENIVGTRGGDDTLTGDANANVLIGSGGTDTLNGGDGNDTLYGDWATDDTSGTTYGLRYYDVSNSSYWGDDILNGGAGDDILIGNGGDDTLDGGAGADTYTGGAGIDVFTIKANDGGASISGADVVTDFDDGTDLIGMSGLEYSQLTIEQGTGDYANHVIVKKTDTGEFLVIIQNISLSSISNADFTAI